MDYTSLAKNLRLCAERGAEREPGGCWGCGYDDACIGVLLLDTADAIEALQRACANYAEQAAEHEAYADVYRELTDKGEKLARELIDKYPKWIPVTERLPEPKFAREWYLVALESGCVKTLAFEKQGRSDNLFRPGWHETASPVTHWMPLPTPPKDGEA